MQLNLKALEAEVRNRLHNQAITAAQLTTWANVARDKILREIKPPFNLNYVDFTSVTAQSEYYIPNIEPHVVRDIVNVTLRRYLEEVTEFDINLIDPAHIYGVAPIFYYINGIAYVGAQPSAASAVTLVSTAIGDTTQKARVYGKLAGVFVEEQVTLTGTTNALTTATFDVVDSVALDSVATGIVTATSNAGGVTLSSIPIGNLYLPYLKFTLYGTPQESTSVYRVYFHKSLPAMLDDNDVTNLPEDWNSLLISMTALEAHQSGYEVVMVQSLEQSTRADIERFKTIFMASRKKTTTLRRGEQRYQSRMGTYKRPVGP